MAESDTAAIDIEKEIDSLLSMIKTKVSREELADDLDRYLNKYLIELEPAKRAIVKEHGGSDSDYIPSASDTVNISEICEGLDCTLVAKVNQIKKLQTKNGTWHNLLNINDDTGLAVVNIWCEDANVREGYVYRFRNCRMEYSSFDKCLEAKCSQIDSDEHREG